MHEQRYFCSGGADPQRTELWRPSSFTRSNSKSSSKSETRTAEESRTTQNALLARVDMLLREALSKRTWKGYTSAVAKYRDYMACDLDENNPSEEALCKWIAFLSLFLEICRYLSA